MLAADGPDGLMEEIPTIVVPPLNRTLFEEYSPLTKPHAIIEFGKRVR